VSRDDKHAEPGRNRIVELTRVQPFEAEVIAAKLREAGITATLGPRSAYESLSFADGVPILVPEEDASRALALLKS
jgi:hypothetical protein